MISSVLAVFATTSVFAEEESVWKFDDEHRVLKEYTGEDREVTVPDTLMGCSVDGVGSNAFCNSEITSLTFPETVQYLNASVAAHCESLSELKLPQSLVMIGDGCFVAAALQEVTIPANVRVFGEHAFSFCQELRSITFEGECPAFGGECFVACPDDLTLYVPDDQLEAYQEAVDEIKDIYPVEVAVEPSGKNAVPAEAKYDNEHFVFDAATGTITEYTGESYRLDVPETIDGVSVRTIGANAFNGNWNLIYLTLPEGLTAIEDGAFESAYQLSFVEFPSTLKTIGNRAFYNYRGGKLMLPEGLERIGDEAFYRCAVRGTLVLPEGLKEIGDSAFARSIFMHTLDLPSTLETIGEHAFEDVSLSYVYMDGLTPPKVAKTAFAECTSLADIELNEYCTKQQMLDLQAIIDEAGLNCRVWRYENTQTSMAKGASYIYNPNNSDEVYLAGYDGEETQIRACNRYRFADDDYKPVAGLGDGAFVGNQTVTYYAVTHNDVFTYIGKDAFADSRIEHVDFFDSVTTIGAGAFRNCTELQELILPESVTEIGDGAFRGCTGLTEVTILCDLALIPEDLFSDCSKLTKVTIANGAIPSGMFANLASLQEVTFGDGVTAIGDRAFAGTSLARVDLNQVKTVGAEAFADAGLTEVDTRAVEQIGADAFRNADMERLVISANLQVNAAAFAGIPTEVIRISDAASDEQVQAWSEALEFPWYSHLMRESETSTFLEMPYQPSPEEDFEFDASTGTITGYTGEAVDVVVPRTIGGEPVRVIGYHAFDAAKDYTDTEMSTNRTEWVHIRSIVIPDTVRTIEDNALSYLQQLELFVSYAPLETTGGTQFMLCRSLKNVIFVNPLKALGNYLFESCDALELVWYPNTLDSVGIQCFSQSKIDALVIDAKVINYYAFARCDNLKEIHLRGSLESLDVSAFAEVPLERLCLETTNPDVITEGYFGAPLESLMVIVPESTTDEELNNFVRKLGPAGKGMIQNQDQIVRGTCTQPDPIPRPDVDALLSEYGIHQS